MAQFERNRREFLQTAAGALAGAAIGSQSAEAFQDATAEIKEATADEILKVLGMNPFALERIRRKSFWRKEGAGDVDDVRQMIINEGKMQIPDKAQIDELETRLKSKKPKEFSDFSKSIPVNGYSVLVDGDYSREKPVKHQIVYLVKNEGGVPHYKMSLLLSASAADWNNKPQSKGSPLGVFPVLRKRLGIYGQIVSNKIEHRDSIPPAISVTQDGTNFQEGYFPNSLIGGDDYAFITTGVFWIDEQRNIGMHGSNKVAGLGFPGSDGCLRISNLGITYLSQFINVGTKVMIHGTLLSPEERRVRDLIGSMRFK